MSPVQNRCTSVARSFDGVAFRRSFFTLWSIDSICRISSISGLALSNQYCQPWARQQENYTLGIPPETARTMSERVRELLGYSIHPPFMGHVNGLHPRRLLE